MLFLWCLAFIPADDVTYDLNPKFGVEDVWHIKEYQKVEVHSPTLPGGAFSYTVETNYRESIIHVDDQGVFTVEVTILDSSHNAPSAVPDMYDLGGLVGIPIHVKMTPRAEILEVETPENLPETGITAFRTLKQMYLNYGNMALNPDLPVKAEETWIRDVPMSIEMAGSVVDQIYTLKQQVSGEGDFEGKPVIAINLEGSFTGTIAQGGIGTVQGEVTGVRYVSPHTAVDCYLELDIHQTNQIATAEGEFAVEVFVDYSRRITAETPVR
ncbi:MAG: hypothetical protein KDC35_19065 [Acidobacteria bacterium]|nr:hypothetical protein [Acidobacteriota bacterium]